MVKKENKEIEEKSTLETAKNEGEIQEKIETAKKLLN